MDAVDPIPSLGRETLGLRLAGARLGGAMTLGELVAERALLVFLRHGG
jgi:hypothetical protein